jgi:hypothetical protein
MDHGAITSAITLALTTENRDRLRRWAVSLALALALHAGVVVAVLSWRYAVTSPPQGDTGPFVVDLAPAPSQPIAAPTESRQPAAGGGAAERSGLPESSGGGVPAAGPAAPVKAEQSTDTGEQKKGEQKTAPVQVSPSETAPAPLENAGRENSEDERSASGGGAGGGGLAPAVPGGGSMSGPIDNRITIVSPFGWRSKNSAARGGAPARKPKAFVLVHPSRGPGVVGQGPADHASAPSTAINAIGEHVATGAHIQDRVRAALARAVGKNAVGGAVPNNLGGASARTGERTVVNAIGATVRFRPRLPATGGGGQPGGATQFGNAGTVHANTLAVINGTGMTRIGSGPGVIGGPARNLSGGINGTTFRLRHP